MRPLPWRTTFAIGLLALAAGCASTTYTPVRTHFNKGVSLYNQENYSGAAREYRLAIEEDPMDFRARFNLAVTLEDLGRKDLARAEYEWILAARPHDLRASINLAAMEIDEGNNEAGYARLQGLVDCYSALALPRVGLATHYLREGRIEEAEVLVRDALKIDDSDVEGNFLLGEILVRKAAGFDAGSPERAALVAEARKAFETSLANAPDDVASLLALGRLERAEGRPGLARSYYRRVVLQKRQSAEAHEALADLHEDSGELEHAVNNLLNLRMLAPERDAEISARLQRLYATLYHREVQRTPATRPAGEP